MLDKPKDIAVYKAMEKSGGLSSGHLAKLNAASTLANQVSGSLKAIGTLPKPPGGGTIPPPAPNPPEIDNASTRILAVANKCTVAKDTSGSLAAYINKRMEDIESKLTVLGEGFNVLKNTGEITETSTLLNDATDVFSGSANTEAITTQLNVVKSEAAKLKVMMDGFKAQLGQAAALVLTAKEKTDLEAALKKIESPITKIEQSTNANKQIEAKSEAAWSRLVSAFDLGVRSTVLIAAVGNPAVKDAAASIMPDEVKKAVEDAQPKSF